MAYVAYFCIYSVFGWGIDTAYRSFVARRYTPGGFSRYPFSPIYGLAALFIIAISPHGHGWPLLAQWAFYAIVLAAYEYLGGAVTHRTFKRRLWDYRREKWDLDGYTGPQFAAAWGALALFVIYVMHPFLEKLFAALP